MQAGMVGQQAVTGTMQALGKIANKLGSMVGQTFAANREEEYKVGTGLGRCELAAIAILHLTVTASAARRTL